MGAQAFYEKSTSTLNSKNGTVVHRLENQAITNFKPKKLSR
jgi:hypothetical protein